MSAPQDSAVNRNGLSRRQVMTAAGAVGLSMMAGEGVFSRALAQTPKPGGRLRMAIAGGAATDTLDPGTWNETYMQVVGFGGYQNNLAEVSSNNKVVPELAESWEPSKDAKIWVFKLRKGVEFHSGKPFTASDVLATFNHHRGPGTTSQAKGLVSAIADIRVVDPSTVRFELGAGNADFPALMTDYQLGILPADKDGVARWRSGDGTGGYRLVTFNPGSRAELSRFPNYWKTGAAHFDEVEVLPINDVAARQNALLTGDVDVADRVDLKTVDLLKRRQNVVIENVPGRLFYTYDMKVPGTAFSDANVRLAMKHAVDRQALLDVILHGYGTVGDDQPISPAYAYFDPTIPQRRYDPEMAKFYLRKAGKSSLAVDLHVSDVAYNGATDAAVLFQQQAAKAGISINIVREPADGYWTRVWGKAPFVASYYTGRPTEDEIFSLAFAKTSGMNTPKWNNPRFNELLIAARAELDPSKRRQMYGEMQRLVRDDGGFIIPVFANYVFARSKKLAHGPHLSSDRSLDGCKLAERWWFA